MLTTERRELLARLLAECLYEKAKRRDVILEGLGVIHPRHSLAYEGRDPIDGRIIPVPEKFGFAFLAGPKMRRCIETGDLDAAPDHVHSHDQPARGVSFVNWLRGRDNDAATTMQELATVMLHELVEAGATSISGVFTLRVETKPRRIGRNPQTAEPVEIPEIRHLSYDFDEVLCARMLA
jgi:nucleoid DNA-binding protein